MIIRISMCAVLLIILMLLPAHKENMFLFGFLTGVWVVCLYESLLRLTLREDKNG